VAEFPPTDHAAGRALGLRPCPRCGDPLGARYRVKGGDRVCWPCTGYIPSAPARPKQTAAARLRSRVYAALDAAGVELLGGSGHVGGLGDPEAGLAGYCPVCRRGLVHVCVIDAAPPELEFDGCSAGCSFEQVKEALRASGH
jgi:hypothetical protein